MKKRHLVMPLAALLGSYHTAQAALWVAPDDARLRHHIQLLADTGVIRSPVSTWPLMWSAIAKDLQAAQADAITPQQRTSLDYVNTAYRQSTAETTNLRLQAAVQDSPQYLGDAADTDREQALLGMSADGITGRFGWQLQATIVDDPQDGDELRLDGSYLAAGLGNWTLAAGASDRWWGPGWQDSLVFSDNARPVPGLSLQRNQPTAFETPLLSWIGPWHLTAFAGQLESDRYVPDAKLLGLRFTLRPVSSLEIGLTRTAQWGGEDRPQSLSSLWDLLLGNDNKGSGGLASDGSNEPGNQLGALDWRWSFHSSALAGSFYGQIAGEDEAGGLPANVLTLLGIDGAFSADDIHSRVRLEFLDTGGKRPFSTQDKDIVYEHHIYRNGYRYKGRPLGASADNDTRQYSLAADHYLDEHLSVNWLISYLDLNRDGTDVPSPGGNVLSDTDQQLWHLRIGATQQYQRLILSAGLDYLSEELTVHGQQLDHFSPRLTVEYRF